MTCRWFPWLWTVLLALVVGACVPQPAVSLGGERFAVEVVTDRKSQALGLMFRESLPADAGMLFVFPAERPRSFWMKNVEIDLDILYFDKQQKLVRMHSAVPPCRTRRCPGYPSGLGAMYVLELNGGTAQRLGVTLGDSLELHHIPSSGGRQ